MISAIYAVVIKDLKNWFRNPFLIVIAILPLILMSFFMGLFLSNAESIPTAIIINDNDPLAIEIKDYITDMKSGAGVKWFTVRDLTTTEVLEQFTEGKILCYIVIPVNITNRLNEGEIVTLEVVINNINDDITKNVLQRIQGVCNHFNDLLQVGSITYYSPKVIWETIVPRDLTFTEYIFGGVLALSVILTAGVNASNVISNEFEKKTIKELVMGSSISTIIIAKMLVSLIETIFCFVFLTITLFFLYGFLPSGNLFILILMIIWGALCSTSVGIILAVLIKQTIPSAVFTLILGTITWWIGGGLVPSEAWAGVIGIIAKVLPGSYYLRSFNNLILLNITDNLFFDMTIFGLYGIVSFAIAVKLFVKEAKLS